MSGHRTSRTTNPIHTHPRRELEQYEDRAAVADPTLTSVSAI